MTKTDLKKPDQSQQNTMTSGLNIVGPLALLLSEIKQDIWLRAIGTENATGPVNYVRSVYMLNLTQTRLSDEREYVVIYDQDKAVLTKMMNTKQLCDRNTVFS